MTKRIAATTALSARRAFAVSAFRARQFPIKLQAPRKLVGHVSVLTVVWEHELGPVPPAPLPSGEPIKRFAGMSGNFTALLPNLPSLPHNYSCLSRTSSSCPVTLFFQSVYSLHIFRSMGHEPGAKLFVSCNLQISRPKQTFSLLGLPLELPQPI